MRRSFPLVALLALSLALAGCQAPGSPFNSAGTATPTEDGPVEMGPAPPDPDEDRIGWEAGYWHNESIDVTPGDGLNGSEQEAVVSRAMARVEHVRELEFEETVSVDVIDRQQYRDEQESNHSESLQRFDNAKFEAMFLIGEDEDSIDVQEETLGSAVLGYYSPDREAIVLVDESETPTISNESVLAHELVHALQDQQFGLENSPNLTRDAYQGRNGLVEGDAGYVEQQYVDRCGQQWSCIDGGGAGEGADDGGETAQPDVNVSQVHPGIEVLEYFPYSDGPGFVEALRDDGGWAAVNDAYDEKPDGATEVVHHDRYAAWEPESVSLEDRTSEDWERIRPPDRLDYGTMGQSAVVASQAYSITDDYNDSAVVLPQQVVNVRPDGSVDQGDPYEYDTPAAEGWAGGRFHAHERSDGELAYVWRTAWESDGEAAEFATGWQDLIDHWGGDPVDDGVWVIDEGPYADAFSVRTDGDTVTVVNAPDRDALAAVHGS